MEVMRCLGSARNDGTCDEAEKLFATAIREALGQTEEGS